MGVDDSVSSTVVEVVRPVDTVPTCVVSRPAVGV